MSFLSEYFPVHDPTWVFFIVLLIILFAPIVMGKLRIPHIIGMVLFGVMIGQYGFHIIERDISFEMFGKIGLYYIMFLASLEMDMASITKNLRRIPIFGLLSFAIPFVLTFVTCRWVLSYSMLASLLLGCIMSSNTLVAYPIVGRYGLQKKPSVTLSVGGTMISLLVSLIVLAMLVASHEGNNSVVFWLLFFVKFAFFCVGMIFFIPRLTRWFLRRYSDTVMQYIFVMSIVVLSAAMSQAVGIEGVFGAFFAGLILNRYIPHVSALMNRIEFIGNAIFIPYFLIGVGMLINLNLLFEKEGLIWIVLIMVVFGTVGKGLAAYIACLSFKLPLSSGHMMFGLTSAHAAGAIAMVMVGMKLEVAPGEPLVTEDILNGVVIMILFTCIISSIITERSAQRIVLRDAEFAPSDEEHDDEKFLVPVKYPEYANNLISLALLMRNPKLNRGIVGLNVVYDDENMRRNQAAGEKLLEQITKHASASDVLMQTQVRIAANIANGIKHAFNEFQASEIIIGLHAHKELSPKFWGQFHQSLFNGLNRQIIMARLHTPLNTIRKIHVAVPSRSQYEPGFYRYLDRLSRMAENLECGINFNARGDTTQLITEYMKAKHPRVRAQYFNMEHWNEMPALAETIKPDHLFVVVTARKGTVSYKNAQERLPEELTQHFTGKNLIIIFPDQHGDASTMTFAEATHTEELSAYDNISNFINNIFRKRAKSWQT
ncbi:MAG: cation:proton antiporter [Prevotella sp.]|nr:cation:proton antiporter [Prevotella sp.]MCF0207966.1 cation:proton antiporter [Bacteroidaceae bacterium]